MSVSNLRYVLLVLIWLVSAGFTPLPSLICIAPTSPIFYGSRPNKPFCASSHTCNQRQIGIYRQEIENHFQKIKRYLLEVESFSEEAVNYAKCMSDLD